MQNISKAESCAITYLRALSIVLILACHFLQGLGNSLAFALNVGVQIFIVISGYLYGKKDIVFCSWIRRRMVSVYVPYALFLQIIFPCYYLFHPEEISFSYVLAHIVNIQEYWGGIKGINHLWYMTAIWICYLLTPIIQYFRNKVNRKELLIISTTTLLVIDLFFLKAVLYYILLYALAYYCSSYKNKHRIVSLLICEIFIFSVICVTFNKPLSLPMTVRCLTAITLLISSLALFLRYNFNKITWLVKFLSDYSYFLYLIHVPLILGPFSMLYYTSNMAINIIMILCVVIVASVVLKSLSASIQYYLR